MNRVVVIVLFLITGLLLSGCGDRPESKIALGSSPAERGLGQGGTTLDEIYCVYIAQNEDLVRQHAQQAGFPANQISAVAAIINPTTAEE